MAFKKYHEIQVGNLDKWYVIESVSSDLSGVNVFLEYPHPKTTHVHKDFITGTRLPKQDLRHDSVVEEIFVQNEKYKDALREILDTLRGDWVDTHDIIMKITTDALKEGV